MRHVKSGTGIGHKHTIKYCFSVNNYKHDDGNFVVMSNKFKIHRISIAIISSSQTSCKSVIILTNMENWEHMQ